MSSSTICYRDIWWQHRRNGAADHRHPTFRLTKQWLFNLFLFCFAELKVSRGNSGSISGHFLWTLEFYSIFLSFEDTDGAIYIFFIISLDSFFLTTFFNFDVSKSELKNEITNLSFSGSSHLNCLFLPKHSLLFFFFKNEQMPHTLGLRNLYVWVESNFCLKTWGNAGC